ncbi:hypothetical protein [uncultured Alistipes sp.]|uniref:hypothetical protein n=1 Tax=uncultured Alistipes sp. TaxID=538949 RepID=UPI00260DF97B|nr:hypothetical protein [uncultured Alistipes sp.]
MKRAGAYDGDKSGAGCRIVLFKMSCKWRWLQQVARKGCIAEGRVHVEMPPMEIDAKKMNGYTIRNPSGSDFVFWGKRGMAVRFWSINRFLNIVLLFSGMFQYRRPVNSDRNEFILAEVLVFSCFMIWNTRILGLSCSTVAKATSLWPLKKSNAFSMIEVRLSID